MSKNGPVPHWAGVGELPGQGEETKARKTGRRLSQPSGTARKPSLSCAPDLLGTEDTPLNELSPNKGRSNSQLPGSHSGTCRIKAACPAPAPPASSTPCPLSLQDLHGSPHHLSSHWPTSLCPWNPSNLVSGLGCGQVQIGPGQLTVLVGALSGGAGGKVRLCSQSCHCLSHREL